MTYYHKQRMDAFKRAMFASQCSKPSREKRTADELALKLDDDRSPWLPRMSIGRGQLAS
jgi:hypothetical protein